MKNINKCPFCGFEQRITLITQTHSDEYLRLISRKISFTKRSWLKCKKCGFIYLSPCLSSKEVKIIYSNYRNFNFRKIKPDDYFHMLISLPNHRSNAYKKTQYIKQNVGNIGSILDIGCGGGILLYHLKKVYPNALIEGIEPDRIYAKLAHEKLGIKVYINYYKKGLINKKYDLLLLCDTLEHIYNFKIIWKLFKNNLNKDGYLFICIPSPDNFKLHNANHDAFNACHYYFYDKKHIQKLAKDNNFKLIKNIKRIENVKITKKEVKDFYILKYIGENNSNDT